MELFTTCNCYIFVSFKDNTSKILVTFEENIGSFKNMGMNLVSTGI